jgi:hypothetical protein
MYKNINLSSEYVVVGKDQYPIDRIKFIWMKELGLGSQVLRFTAIALQFSCVGWLGQYWLLIPVLSLYLPLILALIGLLYALLTFRRYELKAQLTPVDETGSQAITLASGVLTDKKEQFEDIVTQWGRRFR